MLLQRIRDVQRHERGLPALRPVHDMRVAARRLRAALRLLGLRELDGAVKELQDALGAVRDLQLQVEWLKGRDSALLRSRQAALRKAEGKLREAVRGFRLRTVPALRALAGRADRKDVRKLLRKRLRKLRERLETARRRPGVKAMHEARIAVKQVRYLIEIAADDLPSHIVPLVEDLKTLQTSLGELHDVDARLALVKSRRPLRREQMDERARLLKIVEAQLDRWHTQRLATRVRHALR